MDSTKEHTGIIDSEISNIEAFLPSKGRKWTDAIEYAVRNNSEKDEFYYSEPSSRTRTDHIHRRLGHIVVNPNNEYNTKAIVGSYVFQNSKGINHSVINYSYESTEAFINELISFARQQYELSYSQEEIDPSGRSLAMKRFFIIHGERGIGKTFYLNYLLSNFSQLFDENKIIWIRLNLVQNFGSDNNLKHWIYTQASKIIFRYYDEKSSSYNRVQPKKPPISEIAKKLSEFVNKLDVGDEKYKESLYEHIIGMKQVFCSNKREEVFSPDLVPIVLGREVVNIAQSAGYTFIIVLDGLDRLEMTKEGRKKFEGIISQINSLAESNDLIGMTFLVATRTCTLEMLSGTVADPYKFSRFKAKELADISLSQILAQRVEFIKKDIQSLATGLYKDRYPDWSLHDWPSHINDFLIFMNREEGDGNYIELTERIYGANKRAQMQIVQLNYHDFLSRIRLHQYQLIESLVKSGKRFPPKNCIYKKGPNKKINRANVSHHQFESRFFPSLFDFPYIPYEDAITSPPVEEGILMGLRCLQLVRIHQKIVLQNQDTSPLLAGELVELVNKLFGYPEDIILSTIYEYADFELLRLTGRFFPIPSSPERYVITSLPKMDYLIDKFLYDIAYLNLCAMRLPLDESAFAGSCPFIAAAAFDNPEKDVLTTWIARKIINTISIYRLIKKINLKQIEKFENNKIKIKDIRLKQIINRAYNEKMFDFVSQMRSSIGFQIKSALSNTAVQQYGAKIDRLIEEYKKIWT